MLFYLLWIPAALTALGIFAASPDLSKWWIVPILIAAFIVWNLLYVLYVWIICKRVDMNEEHHEIDPFYAKNTMIFIEWLLAVCGVKVRLTGREWLPESGEFLLVSNHRSAFDPLATAKALKDIPLAFISKPENIYKLFLGSAAWRAGYLPIDRENARNALQTINEAAERMKNHVCSYAIYPEGTRTKDGNLQEFHRGSFKPAVKAKVPVVVMAAENTDHAEKGLFFRPVTVELTILERIDADVVAAHNTAWLAEHAREVILAKLGH